MAKNGRPRTAPLKAPSRRISAPPAPVHPLPDDTASAADALDRSLRAAAAMRFGGASPWAAFQAWQNWAFHMALSPARRATLAVDAWTAWAQVAASAAGALSERPPPVEPPTDDRRFRDAGWRMPPFDTLMTAQLAMEAFWRRATEPLPGTRARDVRRVRFMGEKILQALAPSNFPWSNPEVIEAIAQSRGQCLVDGAMAWSDDLARALSGQRFFGVETYEVGRNLATTPGEVVFRNDLMDLIQYAPATPTVRAEPVLIVPAWIMKYYVLDLSPGNSLVRHLVERGFTVFCISWKNPGADARDWSMEDYRTQGVLAALDAVQTVTRCERTHLVGYCLGGTMAALAAASCAHDPGRALASLTLLAAQTDFAEAGELMLFTDESQVSALEDMMDARGFLDARQMAGAFYALRANELLWTRVVERYLMGVRRPATDLDAWLADATRMPARMHSEYLRWLFQENQLTQGKFRIDDTTVSLKDVHAPIFAVGAELDHIAPWRSVFKVALFATAGTTFVLSGGGHNSAIVSPPGKPGAYHRTGFAGDCDDYLDPDAWEAATPRQDGSWWPAWVDWLDRHSGAVHAPPPAMGASLGPAPGTYVHER